MVFLTPRPFTSPPRPTDLHSPPSRDSWGGVRVAIVHDWLTGMRGGERVLSRVCRLFPSADLYTLIHVPGSTDAVIEGMRIRASGLSKLPGVKRFYRHLLPLMPSAVERFDLKDYDLAISLSHCVAKGFRRDPAAAHVCYCFTPMRYVWSDVGDDRRGGVASLGLRALTPWLRRWDLRSAANVDRFLALGEYTAGRIRRCYGREADVVPPPVDTDYYTPAEVRREGWYLVVSALTPYKRVEDAIVACGDSGRELRVIGSGPDAGRLRSLAAKYPHVSMLGWQSDESVRDHYRRCKALLMPQEEDFGIVPVEAMACGAPVIAFGAGGARETVVEGETGLFYGRQDAASLAGAMERFEGYPRAWEAGRIVAHARRFGAGMFDQRFVQLVREAVEAKGLRFT